VDQFRAEQVVWGAAGLAIGLSVSALLVTGRHAAALPLLVFCLASGVAGVVARDHWLTREVRAREARMLAELPTVAELIALAVAAGEGPVGALERVAIASTGELSAELTRVVSDAHAGAGFTHALSGLASRTSLPSLARFVDGMIVAIERGTPLADVLRAQAVDARDIGRRALLEAGGRKEIAMMVPIVFLVLPVTVLFAMFPGWAAFSFSAS
jgi:tight adherence protein C